MIGDQTVSTIGQCIWYSWNSWYCTYILAVNHTTEISDADTQMFIASRNEHVVETKVTMLQTECCQVLQSICKLHHHVASTGMPLSHRIVSFWR